MLKIFCDYCKTEIDIKKSMSEVSISENTNDPARLTANIGAWANKHFHFNCADKFLEKLNAIADCPAPPVDNQRCTICLEGLLRSDAYSGKIYDLSFKVKLCPLHLILISNQTVSELESFIKPKATAEGFPLHTPSRP